jgi:hypothetical protein
MDSSAVMTSDSVLRGDAAAETPEAPARDGFRAVSRSPTSSAISSPGN